MENIGKIKAQAKSFASLRKKVTEKISLIFYHPFNIVVSMKKVFSFAAFRDCVLNLPFG